MPRRMFSPDIVESDAFLDMPTSSQALYFHLGMYADDDGFVNPKKIMRIMGAGEDDIKVLIGKRFVLPFDSGVVVIKHWRINNLIRKDWHRETSYIEELNSLTIKENGSYTELVNESLTIRTHRLDKDSIVKDSIKREQQVATPSQETKLFFTDVEKQEEVLTHLKEKGIEEQLARREISKFISYWTEPTKSGNKQRWELEKAFEITRRLGTWFSRINNFNKQKTITSI